MRIRLAVVASFLFLGLNVIAGEAPQIILGPADQLAIDQPRVSIQLVDQTTGQVLGPDFAATFLLDTGANSILAVDDSVYELNQNGYKTEGVFYEQGVGGFTQFDVSAEYELQYIDSDTRTHSIKNARILSSTETSFCPVDGFCSFFGIAGMPLMIDRVTTMNLSAIAGGGGQLDPLDPFNGSLELDFLATTFGDELPPTNKRRYSVALTPSEFEAEGDGPLPIWADLPFVKADSVHEGVRKSANFIVDTGAQMSIISESLAFSLGLDKNGNGILFDEAIGTQAISGVGGQIDAPLMTVEELRVPTEEGIDMTFTNLIVAVVDIDPSIDGLFGMNYFTSGYSGAAFGGVDDEDALRELLEDAGLGDLLDQLGGLALGGEVSPYAFFDRVHLDFRGLEEGSARIYFDLTDDVTGIVAPVDGYGDLDGDHDVDFDDLSMWVHDVNNTYFGDANLDGVFDSADLVAVFEAAEYDDNVAMNSTWAEGDWNGDGDFDSRDLVIAFQDGGYNLPSRAAASVPEPRSVALLTLVLTGMAITAIRHG